MNGFTKIPVAKNEPVKNYAPNSNERILLINALNEARGEIRDIPMYINGEKIYTGKTKDIFPPHDNKTKVGHFHKGDKSHVVMAIDAALSAKNQWENMPWEHRAAIFLRAADLIAGPYRAKLNAATMIGQSKNAYQAEIDASCELIDFLRFNVQYMTDIYAEQPSENSPTVWNRLEYRALEGFVFALTPFNFTAIAANLPASAAMMGNTIVWKPSDTQIYSAQVLMEIFIKAGLPKGVINLVFVDGPTAGDVIFKHKDFAGIHFTGSTAVFKTIWKNIAENIDIYKTYPRIVGETGGKDFIIAHKSADIDVLVTAAARGAFEYQGQKCSAASRLYVPDNLYPSFIEKLANEISTMKMGPTEDFSNFINAVIDEKSFNKLKTYIDNVKTDADAEIVCGGVCDSSKGWFISPTVILAKKPDYITLCEELFGPVLTVYCYPADDFENTLTLVDNTSPYALTGSIIAEDRYAIMLATDKLRHAAGNFYINDKPTGAVVGQQPFGGARASGTNDKAGSKANLMRWTSMRTIKETLLPATDYRYPFLD